MRITERFVQSKTGAIEDCEDKIVTSPHFAAVIDGATNKSDLRYGDDSPGQVAAELLCNTIKEMAEEVDVESAAALFTESIHRFYESQDLLERVRQAPHERSTASVVIYSEARKEVWLIGDCQCLVDDVWHQNNKKIDEITASARALFLELELQQGKSVETLQKRDTGRDFIQPLLTKQAVLQNASQETPYSFAVIDGFEIDSDEIVRISVPADAETITLASDGYPFLHSSLEESESALRNVLEADPLLIREYKATKGLSEENVSFDDRAYLRLEV